MKQKFTNFMRCFILFILFCVPILIHFGNIVVKDNNIDKEKIMQHTDTENIVNESLYTVEGTITKITFADTSKTSRVKRLVMRLHLRTSEPPYKDLKFTKRPVLESDKLLHVGQRVSITARKNEISDYPDKKRLEHLQIIHIEPL